MKAIVWTEYGSPDVLQLQELPKPEPKPDQVLIKHHAVNAFPGDAEMRRFQMHPSMWLPVRLWLGLTKPRIPVMGQEFAGTIEQVGSKVVGWQPGDEVFGLTGAKLGSYAEYNCVYGRGPLAKKPANISFAEASTLAVGGGNAAHFIELARLEPHEHILINGACGSIGTYAVQLAKLAGAEVTVVDSADKLDLLQLLGADHLIDYQQISFTDYAAQQGVAWDVILDIVGTSPFNRSLKCLNEGGRYLLANHGLTVMLRGMLTTKMSSSYTVRSELANTQKKDLQYLARLIEAEQIRAVIDRSYPLSEAAEAHRYIETGQRQGHVVMEVG